MSELIDQILNSFSLDKIHTDTAEGIVLLLGTLIIGHMLWDKAVKAIGWTAGMLTASQIFYGLGQTRFNELINFKAIFNIDLMGSVAKLITNTDISHAVSWFGNFIVNSMTKMSVYTYPIVVDLINNFNNSDLPGMIDQMGTPV